MTPERDAVPEVWGRAERCLALISAGWLLLFVMLTLDRAPLTGDEAMLLSVSASFAERGVLGSGTLAGVYGGEDHYFLSWAGQHVLHYLPFRVMGPNATTGRALSVVMVALLAVSTAWVAGRRSGALAAALAVLLLVFWRNGIVSSSHGLTLVGVSRSVRYDATVAALMAATMPLLAAWSRRPGMRSEIPLGVVVGAAIVTHFPALVLPFVLLLVWLLADRPRPPLASVVRVALIAGLVCAPYVAWVLAHAADAAGQFSLVHGGRARAIGGIGELWANGLAEPGRYLALLEARGLGPMLFVAAVPALALMAIVSLRRLDGGARIAAVHLTAYIVFLALLEPTKAPIYALPLLAPVIILMSAPLARLVRLPSSLRWVGIGLLCAIVVEGAVAYGYDAHAMRGLARYDTMAASIRAAAPAQTAWVGPMRWSWAFRHESYTALHVLWLRAQSAEPGGDDLRQPWLRTSPTALIETPEWHADLARLPERGRLFVVAVTEQCSTVAGRIEDRAYGPVVVRTIDRACVAGLAD